MPINTQELIEAVQVLANDHNIRVTVKTSLKASAIVAGTTFVCGVLLGPLGIPIGATAGGLYAYRSSDNYKPLALVIRDDMTDEQRERLCQHIIQAFNEFNTEDLISLTMLLPMLTNPSHGFQTVALQKIISFLTTEMKMQILD